MKTNIVSAKNDNLPLAESELVEKLNKYTTSGWNIYGGISHAIAPPIGSEPVIHYLSVIVVSNG